MRRDVAVGLVAALLRAEVPAAVALLARCGLAAPLAEVEAAEAEAAALGGVRLQDLRVLVGPERLRDPAPDRLRLLPGVSLAEGSATAARAALAFFFSGQVSRLFSPPWVEGGGERARSLAWLDVVRCRGR